MAAPLPADEVASLIQGFARPLTTLENPERAKAEKAAEVFKHTCREAANRLVADASHGPILQSCSADGTPIEVSQRAAAVLPSGRIVRRSGKASHEFLVAVQFNRFSDSDGSWPTCAVTGDPRPLTLGKSADRIFEACRAQWASLRQMGHRGGAIQHYVFDRCAYSKLCRRMEQWHELVSAQWQGESNLGTKQLPVLEWVVFTACACHDAHNSCKWGLPMAFGDADLMRDCFVGVDAVRRSFDVVLKYIGEWVSAVLTPSEPLSEHEREMWRQTWLATQQGGEILDLLCKLELRQASGRLLVSSEVLAERDLVGQVVAAILSVWKFERFSESRWLTVGSSARTMIAACLTGLSDFLSWVKGKPGVSGFYLNGFWRLTGSRWLFLCQVALYSQVPDSILGALLADNRVARTAGDLRGRIKASLQRLADLPNGVWGCLAGVAGVTLSDLRSTVLRAAQRSAAFFQNRVLDEVEGLPWRLCAGNVAENLQELAGGPRPEDAVGGKIWDLLRSGYNSSMLRRMVELLADAPWTTTVVEQLHASAALISRHHPDYGLRTLLARAALLTAGKLMPVSTSSEKQLARKRRELGRLRRRQPQKASGRQLFLQEMTQCARRLGRTMTKLQSRSVQRRLMQRHGQLFRQQPRDRRRHFEQWAAARAEEKAMRLLEAQRKLRMEIDDLERRVVADEAPRHPLFLKAAKWTPKDFNVFAAKWNDGTLVGEALNVAREDACRAPAAMSAQLLQALDGVAVPARAGPQQPSWLAKLCQNRDIFEQAVLIDVRDDVGDQCWMVNFARQSPYYLSLTQLRRVESPFPLDTPRAAWEGEAANWRLHEFEIDWLRNVGAEALLGCPAGSLWVLLGIHFVGGRRLVSDLASEPLEEFLRDLPPPPARAAPSAGSRGGDLGAGPAAEDDAAVEKELPWASAALRKRRRVARDASPAEAPPPPEPEGPWEEDDLVETLAQDACSELEELRLRLLSVEAPRHGDFEVTALGGGVDLGK
jgi:hypothetical protein